MEGMDIRKGRRDGMKQNTGSDEDPGMRDKNWGKTHVILPKNAGGCVTVDYKSFQ